MDESLVIKRQAFADLLRVKEEFDITKIPESVNEIRIVEIVDFDRRPCRDPHVDNTSEIGYFEVLKIEKAGKNRYRFSFKIKE